MLVIKDFWGKHLMWDVAIFLLINQNNGITRWKLFLFCIVFLLLLLLFVFLRKKERKKRLKVMARSTTMNKKSSVVCFYFSNATGIGSCSSTTWPCTKPLWSIKCCSHSQKWSISLEAASASAGITNKTSLLSAARAVRRKAGKSCGKHCVQGQTRQPQQSISKIYRLMLYVTDCPAELSCKITF